MELSEIVVRSTIALLKLIVDFVWLENEHTDLTYLKEWTFCS